MVKVETFSTHIHDVVIEIDTGGAPHDDLLGIELLEVSSGGGGHRPTCSFITPLEVLYTATICLASHGGKIHAHQFEYVGYSANQVSGAEYVAAQI